MTDREPFRVLLVEDSETDAKLISRELWKGHSGLVLKRVDDEVDFREALRANVWDIIISDWSLPRFAGSRALAIHREMGLDLPFIIVSGVLGEAAAVEALRAGATDFVLKDQLARLGETVEREADRAAMRRAQRRTEDAQRQSQRYLSALAGSGVLGIVVTDREGHFLEANDAYLGMVGYSKEELLSGTVPPQRLWPPETARARDAVERELLEVGVAPARSLPVVHKDGSLVAVLCGTALVDRSTRISFVVDSPDEIAPTPVIPAVPADAPPLRSLISSALAPFSPFLRVRILAMLTAEAAKAAGLSSPRLLQVVEDEMGHPNS
jgi:PAS domain S-box-containing protein